MKKRINIKVITLISCSMLMWLSSIMTSSAQILEKNWTVENVSPKLQINNNGDTLEIINPDGLTLWYNKPIKGNYEISYRVKMIMKGGVYDRLSDLNCFWGAKDTHNPDNLFARSKWRHGVFTNYNTLTLFYVGFGGNNNKTTRYRKYHGRYYGIDETKIRPLLQELSDTDHLLKPNVWYEIKIKVKGRNTTYSVNGEQFFKDKIKKGEGDGYFGLRLLKNHVLFTDFKISSIK